MEINEGTKKSMLFGSGEASITPNIYTHLGLAGYGRQHTCKGVHDRIYVRSNVFLDESGVKLLLLNYDLTGFGFKNGKLLRTKIEKELDIDPSKIHFFSTHSHYSPGTEGFFPAPVFPQIMHKDKDPYLIEFIIKQTLKSIKIAIENAVPAKLGYDKLQHTKGGIYNKKAKRGFRHQIHPRIHLIKIEDLNNNIIGAITTFPTHPVLIDREYNEICGGWPGYFIEIMRNAIIDRNKKDLKVVPLIFQGPSGNVSGHYIGKIDKKRESMDKKEWEYYISRLFAKNIADYATELLTKIKTEPIQSIMIKSTNIWIPINPIYEKLDRVGWRNILYAAVKRVIILPGFRFFRRGQVTFINMEKGKMKNKRFKRMSLKTKITTIALNDVIIAGNPGEPYYDLEKKLQQYFSYKKIFVAELCDDAIGYNWTEIEKVYYPLTYDAQISFTPMVGIYTKNTSVKQIKEILSELEEFEKLKK